MDVAIGGQSLSMAQLPTQSQFGDYSDWPGRDVLDSGGQRLGGVREIYLDRETGRPEWVLVDVTDSEARFVPLANADVESWSIRVAHDAEKIRSAPGIGAEPRIDQSEERRLYAHYGLGYSEIDRGSEEAPPAPTGWGAVATTTPVLAGPRRRQPHVERHRRVPAERVRATRDLLVAVGGASPPTRRRPRTRR